MLNAQKDYSTAANPFKLHKFSENTEHSVQAGLKALQWILSPIGTDQFFRFIYLVFLTKFYIFSDIFQKRVLVLKRITNAYFDNFFNTEDFNNMIKNVGCFIHSLKSLTEVINFLKMISHENINLHEGFKIPENHDFSALC